MRRAHDAADFAGKDAAVLGGRTWIYVRADPATYALAFFGRPSVADIARLLPALAMELAPGVPPHVSLVDARRVDAVEPTAFFALHRYVEENRPALAERVLRLGLVRPSGFAGAVVAGFYALLERPPYPTKVVASSSLAARFLERPELPALYEPLVDGADATPAIVRGLQDLFRARGFELDMHEAARALSLSPRTLQRRLQEARTQFIDVRQRARLDRAKERLLDDDDAGVTEIALDLGFASAQHFSSLFKKETGRTPTAWRRLERPPR